MASLDPETLIEAYCNGVFPMADPDGKVRWYTADPRGVFPLDQFHIPKNLAQLMRSPKNEFEIRINHNFERTMRACMEQRTSRTWINQQMIDAYLRLHDLKLAHSVEVWQRGELAGGLYGVSIRGAFFGESMFSRRSDASKVALAWLVARLKTGGYTLLDCQFMTPHLASLGAVSISRRAYVSLLSGALGGAGDGGGGASGAGVTALGGSAVGVTGSSRTSPPDLLALDRLLEATGASGSATAEGYVIAQLLGQTS